MLDTKDSSNTSSTAHTWDLSVNTFGKSHNKSGAPNENIVQNHLNIALLNVF